MEGYSHIIVQGHQHRGWWRMLSAFPTPGIIPQALKKNPSFSTCYIHWLIGENRRLHIYSVYPYLLDKNSKHQNKSIPLKKKICDSVVWGVRMVLMHMCNWEQTVAQSNVEFQITSAWINSALLTLTEQSCLHVYSLSGSVLVVSVDQERT